MFDLDTAISTLDPSNHVARTCLRSIEAAATRRRRLWLGARSDDNKQYLEGSRASQVIVLLPTELLQSKSFPSAQNHLPRVGLPDVIWLLLGINRKQILRHQESRVKCRHIVHGHDTTAILWVWHGIMCGVKRRRFSVLFMMHWCVSGLRR